jgi:hypothetical protein
VNVLAWLADWQSANEMALAERGIRSSFELGHERQKRAAWVNLERDGYSAQALVWESGEVELVAGTPERPFDEHHEITTRSELDGQLERLARIYENRGLTR